MIKLLMFYDLKGWAWWHRINNITKNQPGDILIHSLQLNDQFNFKLYDFIVVFDSYVSKIIFKVPKEKLIIGCSCPANIKEFIHALHVYKPVAGLVNNKEMYDFSKGLYRVFNCPNGVDADLFKPAIKGSSDLTACWVGNSKHIIDKGIGTIKQVCKDANMRLIVHDRAELGNNKLISHEELRDQIYHKADYFICYSDYEGTPNPALEALACGLPVISTRVGNMPEIINNGLNGFLIDRNEKSLYDAIQKLKCSDLQKMSIEARKSILMGWTWKDKAQNYCQLFRVLKEEQTRDGSLTFNSGETGLKIHFKNQDMQAGVNKKDLKDVTFVLIVRLDSVERLENILAVCEFILENFNTSVNVTEFSHFNNGFLKKLLNNRVNYSFEEDNDIILHRTKLLNRMTRKVNTPIVSIWDTDVIISAIQVVKGVELLRKGEADFVIPYQRYALDTSFILRKLFLKNRNLEFLEQNKRKMKEMYPPNPMGGAFLCNLKNYNESGLENENFYGWGHEDGERFHRWQGLGYRIRRIPGPLFHLSHSRGINSTFHDVDQSLIKRREVLNIIKNKPFTPAENNLHQSKSDDQ